MSSHAFQQPKPTELDAAIADAEQTHLALGILVDLAKDHYLQLLNERRAARQKLHGLYSARHQVEDAQRAVRAVAILKYVQSLED